MSTSRIPVSLEIDVSKAQNMKFKSLDFQSARNPIDNNQSQMPTLQQSAIRSINKYYQSNNVKDILGYEESLLSKQLKNSEKIDYQAEVSNNMMSLKQSYDTLRNKYTKLEKEIIKMRNELEIMKQTETTLSIGVYGSEEVHEQMQLEYEKFQQQLLEVESNRKTYLHMINRMRQDNQVFKLQVNQRKDTLDQSNTVLNQANVKLSQISFKEVKAQIALEEVKKHKQLIQQERELNLTKFQQEIEQQVDLEKQRDERIKRQQEIAEIAQTDMRDTNIKKWRQLFLVNQFLSTFLKRKMEKEMSTYENIEKSFQKIKAATGICEAGEIVHKFLNRESTYSRLLISIEEYEQKIDNLKKSNEQLKEKLQNLKAEQPQDRLENKQTLLEIDELITKYQNTSNKAENARLIEQKIYNWGINYLAKIERVLGISNEKIRFYQQKYKKSDIPKLISEILKHMLENLTQVDSEQVERMITNQYRNVENLDHDNDFKKRNNRIKEYITQQSNKGTHERLSRIELTEQDTSSFDEQTQQLTYDAKDTLTTK
ncbi:hypothetical protein TTHERM_00091540 (macronuclear) [Tetrahymena thermophila SB210]|uniref:Uncharacterized protein n=1 Tax=Tetrahymena thermophila (strain SB210) TaxID=312017 RepID=Q236D9_TETTS|nr:hypothetical protein TTHERM_00091540 [Tetrahymena thermophila SB210]EAR92561.2 hypothetical protein TTHERM_00091540 [Tetrahymena thermophila SB210]|eukprot:XP_001012806.2 hypothetical protein TTHERM_00091540 [Tetrahymena thermophila SB210]